MDYEKNWKILQESQNIHLRHPTVEFLERKQNWLQTLSEFVRTFNQVIIIISVYEIVMCNHASEPFCA